ncbi:MAG: TPP-binding protein [Rhodobacteraceae bacterium]|nr:TPP-binding protein [Paracoccaceae bacterium]
MPNAAERIVEGLATNGIETLFCLPGIQNDPFFDALHRHGGIRALHSRHEQGAAYMALGAALATGQPQAYCVVPGPGFLNTTAALATAYSAQAPVLALTGQIPRPAIGKGRGLLHEIPDQMGTLRSLTRWAARIERGEDAGPLVEEAFGRLRSPAGGPVGLEVPLDVWQEAGGAPAGRGEGRRPEADAATLDRAAALLDAAERPMIVVGGGAQEASAEVRALAEALQAPVMSFRMGHGVLDARHPLHISLPAGRALWAGTDLVLGIGSRLSMQLGQWGRDEDLRVVHLTADPEEPGRFGPTDVALVADAAEGAAALLARLSRRNRPARSDEIAAAQDRGMAELRERLAPQMRWLDTIRAVLPEDGILVDELTQLGYVSRFGFDVFHPRGFLSSGYQGTLGWGLATALGAKAARPQAKVVSISGDGGFMFTASELATAKRHGIAIVAIVMNDNAFGNVRRIQQTNFEGRTIASDLANPDFVAMARAFGLQATRAETPEALRVALGEALAADETVLIEVPQGEMPDPFGYIAGGRIRG